MCYKVDIKKNKKNQLSHGPKLSVTLWSSYHMTNQSEYSSTYWKRRHTSFSSFDVFHLLPSRWLKTVMCSFLSSFLSTSGSRKTPRRSNQQWFSLPRPRSWPFQKHLNQTRKDKLQNEVQISKLFRLLPQTHSAFACYSQEFTSPSLRPWAPGHLSHEWAHILFQCGWVW